jgi:hypothetical protein
MINCRKLDPYQKKEELFNQLLHSKEEELIDRDFQIGSLRSTIADLE